MGLTSLGLHWMGLDPTKMTLDSFQLEFQMIGSNLTQMNLNLTSLGSHWIGWNLAKIGFNLRIDWIELILTWIGLDSPNIRPNLIDSNLDWATPDQLKPNDDSSINYNQLRLEHN